MRFFNSLKTYFSAFFLLLVFFVLTFTVVLLKTSFDDAYSSYDKALNKRVASTFDQLNSRSSASDAELMMQILLDSTPELASVKYSDSIKEKKKLFNYKPLFFEGVLFGVEADKMVKSTAYNTVGSSIEYNYSPSYFLDDWRIQFMRYLIFSAIALVSVSFLYVISMSSVRPISRLKNAAMKIVKGEAPEKVKIKGKDEIATLSMFFNDVVQNLKSVSSELDDRERLKSELVLAAKIQGNLLPQSSPIVPGLDITAKNRPAAEVGGDIFNFIEKDKKLLFYIGDATGHGVPAGLVMTMTDVLIHMLSDIWDDLPTIISNLNRVLFTRTDKTMFITFVMFQYDLEKNTFNYCGAGHEQILIYRSATSEVEVITPGGVAAGMFPDVAKFIKPASITLNEGDSFMLFTDGLVEARNSDGEMFGLNRVIEKYKVAGSRDSSEKILNILIEDFKDFINWEGYTQEDDISAIVVRRVKQGEQVGVNLELNEAKSTKWTWEK